LELPFHGWKSPEIALGKMWIEFCVRLEKSGPVEPHKDICHIIQISPHVLSGFFQPWKRSSEARNFEVINSLQHVFEKWVEHLRCALLAKGGTLEKRPSLHLHKVPTCVHELFKQPS
jgi:hypothetical protein